MIKQIVKQVVVFVLFRLLIGDALLIAARHSVKPHKQTIKRVRKPRMNYVS